MKAPARAVDRQPSSMRLSALVLLFLFALVSAFAVAVRLADLLAPLVVLILVG